MSAPLNDTEATRLMALWEQDRKARNLTAVELEELDTLAKRIKITPWPPIIPPPGTPPPTIIIPKPHPADVICNQGGGGPEA